MKQLFSAFAAFAALAGTALAQCFDNSLTFSPLLYPGPSEVQFTSCGTGADGPRVNPINATTFDWWYFDAVSDDGSQALTVIFFTSSFIGFSFDLSSVIDPLNVAISATFENGTTSSFSVEATSVEVTTVGNGASGRWVNSGIGFAGAPDLSTYNVTLSNDILGLHGTFTLRSRGPGHYFCTHLEGGVDEHILPDIGWVNVMPAADASVNVTLQGQVLQFQGNGCHDKNWGDAPFATALQSWYWGHGTFGNYQLVFFDMIDAQGTERAGGYVLQEGKVVGSTCSTTGLQVRPVGTPYPPTLLSPNPDALTINMTLNDGSTLYAIVNQTAAQADAGLYSRWIGTIDGTVNGVSSSGSALWEQFKIEL